MGNRPKGREAPRAGEDRVEASRIAGELGECLCGRKSNIEHRTSNRERCTSTTEHFIRTALHVLGERDATRRRCA